MRYDFIYGCHIPPNLKFFWLPAVCIYTYITLVYFGTAPAICQPIGSAKFLFFVENALKKKLPNIFSNFVFYLNVQSLRLIMENNFIQMAASADQAVAYTIDPICMYNIDCVPLYFINGFTNIIL